MAALELRVGDLDLELETIKAVGRRFLEGTAPDRIDDLRRQLKAMAGNSPGRWATGPEAAIQTRPARDYAGGQGEDVWGTLEFAWDLAPVKNRKDLVRLAGTASSRLAVWRNVAKPERVAMWRMEIGTDGSPGCYFHIQVLGQEDRIPFPRWLEVPRIPIPFTTPAVALEYLLGELHQVEWNRITSEARGAVQAWSGLQARRIESVMRWQMRVLSQRVGAAPWTFLKLAKPDDTLIADLRSGHN